MSASEPASTIDEFNSVVAAFHFAILERRDHYGNENTKRRLEDLAAFVKATSNNMLRACTLSSDAAWARKEENACLEAAIGILRNAMQQLDAGGAKQHINYTIYDTLFGQRSGSKYEPTLFQYHAHRNALIGGAMAPGRRARARFSPTSSASSSVDARRRLSSQERKRKSKEAASSTASTSDVVRKKPKRPPSAKSKPWLFGKVGVHERRRDTDDDDDDESQEQSFSGPEPPTPVRATAREAFERQFNPDSDAPETPPTFPSDLELQRAAEALAARELKKNRLRWTRLSTWWQRREPNFRNFVVVDNAGGGDCFYYALAPMLKILKPAMFDERADVLSATRDMMRLREILALNVPRENTADYRGLLDSYDHDLLEQGMNAYYAYDYANSRRALQLQLMQPDHWASLGDLELAQRAFGGNVGFIVINRLHQKRMEGVRPSIACVAPESLVSGTGAAAAAAPDAKVRYLLVLYDGQHYMRMRHKNGQFAFSEAELRRQLPNLWDEYSNHCFADTLSRTLVRAVADFIAMQGGGDDDDDDDDDDNNRLARAVHGEEFGAIVGDLWRLPTDNVDAVYERHPELKRYSALSDAQKRRLFNALATPQQTEQFIQRREKKAAV